MSDHQNVLVRCTTHVSVSNECSCRCPLKDTSWQSSARYTGKRLCSDGRDDTQVYLSVPVDVASSATARLSHYIANVATWFHVNQLRLNLANNQIIWLGSKRQVKKVNILCVPIMATSVQTVDSACDLGVTVDSNLTMTTHVSLSPTR